MSYTFFLRPRLGRSASTVPFLPAVWTWRDRWVQACLATVLAGAIGSPAAQADPPIVPGNDGFGTTVTTEGNRSTVTGGTSAGTNLFHSFLRFSIPTGQEASFLVPTNIENVVTRVMGGQASIIDGRLSLQGANANFYLLNPAGILFGSGASLNVPASFMATTATGVQFGDGGWLPASGCCNAATLTGQIMGLRFEGQKAGAIANFGTLSVPGTLSLIGGTVLNAGTLSGRQVLIQAVSGPSLVKFSAPGNVMSLEVSPLANSSGSSIAPLMLPELLTGAGSVVPASNVAVAADGTVSLTSSSGSIALPIQPGTAIGSGKITSQEATTIQGRDVAIAQAKFEGSTVDIGATRTIEFLGTLTFESGIKTIVVEADRAGTGLGNLRGTSAGVWESNGATVSFKAAAMDLAGPIKTKGGSFSAITTFGDLNLRGSINTSGSQATNNTNQPTNGGNVDLRSAGSAWITQPNPDVPTIDTSTTSGQGGNIYIETVKDLLFSEVSGNQTAMFTGTTIAGSAGSVKVSVDGKVQIGGAVVTTSQSQGNGGDVTIRANQTLSAGGVLSTAKDINQAGEPGSINLTAGGDLWLGSRGSRSIEANSYLSTQGAEIVITSTGGSITIGEDILALSPFGNPATTISAKQNIALRNTGGNDYSSLFSLFGGKANKITLNSETGTINLYADKSGLYDDLCNNTCGSSEQFLLASNDPRLKNYDLSANRSIWVHNGSATFLDQLTFTSLLSPSQPLPPLDTTAPPPIAANATATPCPENGDQKKQSGGKNGSSDSLNKTSNTDNTSPTDSPQGSPSSPSPSPVISTEPTPISSSPTTTPSPVPFPTKITISSPPPPAPTPSPVTFSTQLKISSPPTPTPAPPPVPFPMNRTIGSPIAPGEPVSGSGDTGTMTTVTSTETWLGLGPFPPKMTESPSATTTVVPSPVIQPSPIVRQVTVDLARNVNSSSNTSSSSQKNQTPIHVEVIGLLRTQSTALTIDPSLLSATVFKLVNLGYRTADSAVSGLVPGAVSLTNGAAIDAYVKSYVDEALARSTPATTPTISDPSSDQGISERLSRSIEPGNSTGDLAIDAGTPPPSTSGSGQEPNPPKTTTTDRSPVATDPPGTTGGTNSGTGNGTTPSSQSSGSPKIPPLGIDLNPLGGTGLGTPVLVQTGETAETRIAAIEEERLAEFESENDGQTRRRVKSVAQMRQELGQVEVQTGVRAAIVYLNVRSASQVSGVRLETTGAPVRSGLIVELIVVTADQAPAYQTVLYPTSSDPTGSHDSAQVSGKEDSARRELRQMIDRFRQRINDPSRQDYQALGQDLYRSLLGSLPGQLAKRGQPVPGTQADRTVADDKPPIDTLVLSLSPELRGLPLAALQDEQGHFFGDRYRFGLLPSLSLVDSRYRSLAQAQTLVIGLTEFPNTDLPALPEVQREVKQIAANPQDRILLNRQATTTAIAQARRQGDYEMIHIATHAKFQTRQPASPGTKAGTQAGTNTAPLEPDGDRQQAYIQLADGPQSLRDFRRQAWYSRSPQLLVLSACETAVEDQQQEYGFAGLAFQSGIPSVLASQWRVADHSTSDLMQRFYGHLRQGDRTIKAEALQKSQRDLRRDPKLQHPYYWSGFVLVGVPW